MPLKKTVLSNRLVFAALVGLATLALTTVSAGQALAASAREIDRGANQALARLYKTTPGAKAGFVVAGQFGDGALRQRGKTVGYYRSVAASYGLQAGVQSFGYVLFFMDQASLAYLKKSEGWELGSGPSLVVLDKGFAKNISTTTMQKGVYAFIFNQKGLMAGVGLQGSKITRIHPNK
jgi:lipid-binding SYLF domain-containing protein